MNNFIILLYVSIGLVYSQCDNLSESQCVINSSCDWIEYIEYGNCSSIAWQLCNNYEGCYVDSEPGWYDSSGPYCTGGTYQIDNSYCQETEFLECSEMNEPECNIGNSCEWIENIVYGNCSYYNNGSTCDANANCSWDCWSDLYAPCECECISGSCYFPIYTNSYCEEIEMPECYEMNEVECGNYDDCVWIVDIEYGNCSNYNNGTTCDANENCFWDLCYGGSYGSWSHCCRGGAYQIDNSSCEEVSFIPGDANGDNTLNVADIVLIVDLILNSEYDEYSDINQDGILNIIDVVELVNRILDR